MSQAEPDDRAAKAARAKAMVHTRPPHHNVVQAHLYTQLKKRQQQKTTGVAGSRSASLASPPPSRSYTPALAEPAAPAEEVKHERDINDL